VDNNGQIQCQLCGEWLQHITWTHLKWFHRMTVGQYRGLFPGFPLQSEDYVDSRMDSLRGSTQPLDLCEERSKIASAWWQTPAGMAQREDMSRNPIVLRGQK